MSEQAIDDQSHYEISLTAGQAFVAFILLLLSLAASFGFGLMIGRGQGDDRLVVRKEPAVVTEASVLGKKPAGKIVELGVADDDFQQPATATDTSAQAPVITEEAAPATATADPASANGASAPATDPAAHAIVESASPAAQAPAKIAPAAEAAAKSGPAYAQLLSTGDQKTAETMATKLIESGFTSAYVERGSSPKGAIFRVRVKFASEADAHAAEAKLREFSKDVWITK